MGAGQVARRYARALFDAGVGQGVFEALEQELESLASLWAESPELRRAIENPVFSAAQKRAVVTKILPRVAPSRLVGRFALLLLDRGRFGVLPLIARGYRDMVDAQLGRVRATVTSARPLDAKTEAEIHRALERRTGKKVVMKTEVDPDLIGGVVARTGGLVLDGSLRAKLAAVEKRLLN